MQGRRNPMMTAERLTGVGVALDGVTRKYPIGPGQWVTAIDDIGLEIAPGRVVAVAGPSGSGKSTLLHVIGAMDSPDAGSVLVGDLDVTRLSRRKQADYRRTIGFVFQRFHLLPALTVLDNVVAPLLPYRTPFDKFARARELLEAVGLVERARSLPSRLSGGQQQRVAIARALINNPGLLLADEPTGNLDSSTGAEIMDLLLDLRRDRGMTVIVATHDPVIASRCDRIVRLRDGRVVDDVAVAASVDVDEILGRIGRLNPEA
jgi:putative ABC transport system ATP-binding protein